MAQMHSYLVMNARSELKFVDEKITSEELDETFNKIALSIENGVDLFDNDDESEIDFTFENDESEDANINLENINNSNLEISNLIDLSASLLNSNTDSSFSIQEEKEDVSIIHGDLDFDIDDMINKFSSNIN